MKRSEVLYKIQKTLIGAGMDAGVAYFTSRLLLDKLENDIGMLPPEIVVEEVIKEGHVRTEASDGSAFDHGPMQFTTIKKMNKWEAE